jgi:hypothetical protein
MSEVIAPFHERLFLAVARLDTPGYYRVTGRTPFVISSASEGEFKLWSQANGGGFRRYPRQVELWQTRDHQKFLLLARARDTFLFEFHPHSSDVAIYPPRHLCI